jgi:transcription elongation factor GreA
MSNVIQAPYTPPSTPITSPRAVITRSGEYVLRNELSGLRHQLEVEFADRLREAREFGRDGSNDDFLQIKEEEAVLRSRIGRLTALLDSAEVVEDTQSEESVDIGSVVEVENTRSGRRTSLRLLGSFASPGPGDVSAISPIGRALLGRSIGESVKAELPSGRVKKLKIVSARAQKDPDLKGQAS